LPAKKLITFNASVASTPTDSLTNIPIPPLPPFPYPPTHPPSNLCRTNCQESFKSTQIKFTSVNSGGHLTIVYIPPAKEQDLASTPCVGVRYAQGTLVKKKKKLHE
jgi:hypothetical protein